MQQQYDLIIIGGGPAGIAAGVYAARKCLKTALITEEIGGQSVVSADIQNWIGTVSLSGEQLAKDLRTHLEAYKGEFVDLIEGERVSKVDKQPDGSFSVAAGDTMYESRALLICSGANRRQLNVPGAEKFEHKGVTYCASCDGPLFSGMDVVVIGGGNAGFESAAQLLAYAKSVTLLHRSPSFRADPITVDRVLEHKNMTAITNANITEIHGDAMVSGIAYEDGKTGEQKQLDVQGVFVEIGMVPSTSFAEGLVDMDEQKRIIVNAKNQQASCAGVWAAGDCTDELYHQNNIAAGDAVKALEDIYVHLRTK